MTSTSESSPTVSGLRAAVLTPQGRGAVATILIEGSCRRLDETLPPLFRAANGAALADQPIGRICFGHWGTTVPEEVVVCRTGPETVEIHCHGGQAAIRRILNDLRTLGGVNSPWSDLLAEKEGRLAAECHQCLAQASTARTADILLQQYTGVLKEAIEAIAAGEWTPDGRQSAVEQLDRLLHWSNFGVHLTRPWRVVLAGRPNVGKSSLINALVGYSRSIVFDQPGTTRDVVTAETAFQGWPVQLADTAGIRDRADELELAGIERARRQLEGADCRILLVDTSQSPQDDDRQLLGEWPEAVVVAHKSDLPDAWGDACPETAMRVSSVTGEGVQELADRIVARLVPDVPPAGTAIPVMPRQIECLARVRQAALDEDEPRFRRALHDCLHGDAGPNGAVAANIRS